MLSVSIITKISQIPTRHEGYLRKNHKKGVKMGVNWSKVESRLQNFAACKILQLPNFSCFLLLFPLVSDMQY